MDTGAVGGRRGSPSPSPSPSRTSFPRSCTGTCNLKDSPALAVSTRAAGPGTKGPLTLSPGVQAHAVTPLGHPASTSQPSETLLPPTRPFTQAHCDPSPRPQLRAQGTYADVSSCPRCPSPGSEHTLPSRASWGPSGPGAQTVPAHLRPYQDAHLTPARPSDVPPGPQPWGGFLSPCASTGSPHIQQPSLAESPSTWHHQSPGDWVAGGGGLPPGGRSRCGGRPPKDGGCCHPAGSGGGPGR